MPKRTWQPPRKSRNPGNLSLDLSQMEQPIDEGAGGGDGCIEPASRRRSDQAAVCSRVTDFLFIGGAAAAKNRESLLRNGITHVINCAANVTPDFYPDDCDRWV